MDSAELGTVILIAQTLQGLLDEAIADKPAQMDLAEQNIQFSDYKTMSHVELRRRRLLIDGGKK